MSSAAVDVSPLQEYVTTRRGRRVAAHTPRLKSRCACLSCRRKASWTPERRLQRSADIRQQYADGRRSTDRMLDVNRRNPKCWTAEADDLLRSLVGRHDVTTIARIISERFGRPRTKAAVVHRVKTLGLSRMAARPYTTAEVAYLFGVSDETVRARLVRTGLLVGTLRPGMAHHGMRFFERADVEKLVREHPEAYDADRLRDPALRALAVAVARRHPVLSTPAVCRLTGAHQRELSAWYLAGLVPSARKLHGVLPGAAGAWVIEAADLPLVRRLAADLAERRRRRDASCNAGHPWAVYGYVEGRTGQRRCRECRRWAQRCEPLRYTLRIIERAEAEARCVGVTW